MGIPPHPRPETRSAAHIHAECAEHPGEIEYPDSGCARCREESSGACVCGHLPNAHKTPDGSCFFSYNCDCEAYEQPAAQDRLQFNPGPLEAVERRDNVTGIAAVIGELRKRTREDRLRVWLALGGTEDDFPGGNREVD